MSEEELAYYVEIILLYFESGNRDFTESVLQRKINEMEGKGAVVMNMLERREKKGIQETKVENAYNLLKLGVDLETVAEGVGLPLDRVQEMKDKIDKKSE